MMMFGGNFAPVGWMTCQGQTLAIADYDVLFNLIGTTYGGDGETTFNLPDMRGRIPIHQGQGSGLSNYLIGQKGGVENVTLTTQQIPAHNHLPTTNTNGANKQAPNAFTILADETTSGQPAGGNAFAYLPPGGTQVTMPAATVANTGGSQPHENIQPIITITWIISLFGVYPSQT
jgi:microcystin-dependent protein